MKKLLLFLISGLVVGICAVYIYYQYTTIYSATLSDERILREPLFVESTKDAVALIQMNNDEIAAAFMTKSKEEQAQKFNDLFQNIRSPQIFRVKTWDKNSMIIWSNTEEIIGKKFESREVEEAFEGKVEVEAAHNSPEQYTERAFKNFAEIYVPIKDKNNKIVGVFEVYKVTEDIVDTLQTQFYFRTGVTVGALVIAFIGIFLLNRFL